MFESSINRTDSGLLIKLVGDLDTQASKDLAEDIEPVLDLCGGDVVLDLSGLKFISSGGLRQLLVVRKQVRSLGGTMTTVGVNSDILQIFRLSGFDEMFGVK